MSYITNSLTRQCQKEALERCNTILEIHNACLVKMFCGSGKSRIITALFIQLNKDLSVIVVPSLALIQQYYDDYLSKTNVPKELSKHKLLNVSSKDLEEKDIQQQNPRTLRNFSS
jgi:superfamily II DNA or RNA helicase